MSGREGGKEGKERVFIIPLSMGIYHCLWLGVFLIISSPLSKDGVTVSEGARRRCRYRLKMKKEKKDSGFLPICLGAAARSLALYTGRCFHATAGCWMSKAHTTAGFLYCIVFALKLDYRESQLATCCL